MVGIRCPTCDSTRVQKSSAIYEQGISRSFGKSGGIGISNRGRITVYSGRSGSTRVSRLAENNAPPSNEAVGGAVSAGCIVPFLVLIMAGADAGLAVVVSIVVAVTLGMIVHDKTKDAHAKMLQSYEQQWYCRRCGSYFELLSRE
jgi:hypothetical protein